MDHGHGVALQPKSDDQGRIETHAVAGDGVVGVGDGLQPQIVEKDLVPGPDQVEALILKLARIEHGAAAEAFPQHADMAARDGYRDMGKKHDAYERHDHQVNHEARQIAVDKPSPPGSCRGRVPVYRPQIRFHTGSPRGARPQGGHSSICGLISISRPDPPMTCWRAKRPWRRSRARAGSRPNDRVAEVPARRVRASWLLRLP